MSRQKDINQNLYLSIKLHYFWYGVFFLFYFIYSKLLIMFNLKIMYFYLDRYSYRYADRQIDR